MTMLTEDELKAIKARHEMAEDTWGEIEFDNDYAEQVFTRFQEDRAALLAEVKRLQSPFRKAELKAMEDLEGFRASAECAVLMRRAEAADSRLTRLVEVVIGWREHDWPAWFCRRTAEAIADRVRETQALIKDAQGDEPEPAVKDDRKDYCGVCGQYKGGPVLCCQDWYTKRPVTKAEADALIKEARGE